MKGLFNKGVQMGKWAKDQQPDVADIAELMFYPGVTTKHAVTDISGRGVGMDAVKQFLAECGGSASLKLHTEDAINPDFIPFELIVTLPSGLFFESEEEDVVQEQAKS